MLSLGFLQINGVLVVDTIRTAVGELQFFVVVVRELDLKVNFLLPLKPYDQ